MAFKIKPKKPSFKKIKKQLREMIMSNNVQAIRPEVPVQTPPEPITVTPFEDFTNVTSFLQGIINQIRLPAHVTAPRTSKLFDDVKKFLQERLEAEVAAKY